MKMSGTANKTLSHSSKVSVTDYQTGDSNTHFHTHTNKAGLGKQKHLITLKGPDAAAEEGVLVIRSGNRG